MARSITVRSTGCDKNARTDLRDRAIASNLSSASIDTL